jgi:NTE family protein/lysophospholipid hydrolase
MRQRLSTPNERRRGHGAVVAIDVDLKEPFSVHKKVTDLSAWNKLKATLNSKHQSIPGIVDILMQVAHVGGLAQRQRTKFSADIYFEPPLTNFNMMDYKKAEQIIDVGYQYTLEQIKDLSSLGR